MCFQPGFKPVALPDGSLTLRAAVNAWEGVKLLSIHFKDHDDHKNQPSHRPDKDMADQYNLLEQLGEVMVRRC